MADPDLQIRGARSSRPLDKEGGGPKNFFRPFGHQFGVEIRGAGPPGPSPGSATDVMFNVIGKRGKE